MSLIKIGELEYERVNVDGANVLIRTGNKVKRVTLRFSNCTNEESEEIKNEVRRFLNKIEEESLN